MSTPIHLDDESVTAIAERIVQLLGVGSIGSESIDATEVARRLGVSRDYVYRHAEELGAVRIGTGPKGRWRFDPVKVEQWLVGSRESESEHRRQPVRPVRRRRTVTLLPIRGESL